MPLVRMSLEDHNSLSCQRLNIVDFPDQLCYNFIFPLDTACAMIKAL